MTKIMSMAVLIAGIILLLLGVNAYDSTSSDVSRFFTGTATDKAMWLLVSGVIVLAIGIMGMARETGRTQ